MKKLMLLFLLSLPLGQVFAQATEIPKEWTLQACIDYAIANNITVKQAALLQESAKVNYTQSKYERFPSLTTNISQNMNNGSSIDPITSNYVTQMVHSTSAGISAQVVLYKGNYINTTIKQNALLVEQNDLFVQESKNNIILSVTEAYLQALYYKEGIQLASNTIASSKEQLDQMNLKYKAGSVAGLDSANLETQLRNDEVSLITAQNNYRQQLINLKQLLELDPLSPFDVVTSELEDKSFSIPDLKAIYEYASGNLPEIQSAKMETNIQQLALKKAKSGYLPVLTLNAGLNSGYTNTQAFDFYKQFDGNFYQSVGLTLSIPIFSKYQNKANVANAKIEIEKSKLSTVSASKQLYLKIESVWQNAVSNESQMKAAIALKNASQLAYEMSVKKSELGALSATDLLVSKNTYLNAQQTYLQAKFSCALYYQLLQFYQGNTIQI